MVSQACLCNPLLGTLATLSSQIMRDLEEEGTLGCTLSSFATP